MWRYLTITLMVAAVAVAVWGLTPAPAKAAIRFHYSGDTWAVSARIGGGYWGGYRPYGGYWHGGYRPWGGRYGCGVPTPYPYYPRTYGWYYPRTYYYPYSSYYGYGGSYLYTGYVYPSYPSYATYTTYPTYSSVVPVYSRLPSDELLEQRRLAAAQPVNQSTTIVVQSGTPDTGATQVTVHSNGQTWTSSQWQANPTPAAPAPQPPVEAQSEPPAPANSYPMAPSYQGPAGEMLKLLRFGDDDARERAARELRKYQAPTVVDALADALAKDGDENVREQAARSLGEMLAKGAHPALRKAAREDRDKDVREAALKAAQKIEAAYDIEP